MCGIIGFVGTREALPIILAGLHRLEYRGYDSAGVALREPTGLQRIRAVGRVSALSEKKIVSSALSGIGHTRWATHGEPSEKNAHPHLDCNGRFALVHNGIIENYAELKKALSDAGHVFKSDTDTEVLVHLIEQLYEGSLSKAVIASTKLVTGTYGIAVISSEKDEIVVARMGSPLVLAKTAQGVIIASDPCAVAEHSREITYLKDGEVAVADSKSFKVLDSDGIEVLHEIEPLLMKVEDVAKGNYAHFMLKEIHEQPAALADTIRGRIRDGRIKLTLDDAFARAERVIFIGCGTSWHAGLLGKAFVERYAGIPAQSDYASEFRYSNSVLRPTDLVVAISQSGETADTLAALKEAKRRGAMTSAIVNVVGSSIAREIPSGVYIHAGPEIGVASTKAFSCQVVTALLFALWLQQERTGSADGDAVNALLGLPELAKKVVGREDDVRSFARALVNSKDALFLGRGLQYPVALEGALKLKEVSYIHAEGYPAAEMKHGPIALIDENMPAVVMAFRDETYDKIVGNVREVKARKGKVLLLTDYEDGEAARCADFVLKLPAAHSSVMPVIAAIPLQLLAYFVAVDRGLDVDKPRNLAKSVTVE